MRDVFFIIATISPITHTCYAISGNWLLINKLLLRPPSTMANTIWKWMKWPAFANLFITPLWDATYGEMWWGSGVLYLLNLWVWWTLKDAGDDDWTRRMKKTLDETVEQINGKLVVVTVVPR